MLLQHFPDRLDHDVGPLRRDAMPAAFGNDKRGIRRELRHFLLMLVPTLFALV
jgi:hypothetical protein